ncbi:MAG TPA: acyl-CoA dehydrogenase family protein [Mycobacteriales bacterium]|nr:acyl-CoA dehydrogenase family protein [Mycobacteriales bacterium]
MEEADFVEILASVGRFVRERVLPREAEIDERDEVPADLVQACKEMGLFGYALPPGYGGLGLTMEQETRLVFELGYTTPALRSLFGTNNGIAGRTVLLGGTEQQRQAWLPRLASGEVVSAFALTEAEAGSDPTGLRTAAVRDGDGWVIDGAKRYITNAPVAGVFMVFARSDPDATGPAGITAFLVPRDVAGLEVGPRDHKMGQFGAWTADVSFTGVRVPADAVVGGAAGVGQGYVTAMRSLGHGRIQIAALCVGMAGRLVDEMVNYARDRRQGGTPIAEFQLVQGLLADSVTEHLAGRSLVLEVARGYDAGTDTRLGPSAAKYFASEMVGRVADRAVQVHGGAGYMRGVPVERFYRDARLFRIYEGTSQIQQLVIARQALRRTS